MRCANHGAVGWVYEELHRKVGGVRRLGRHRVTEVTEVQWDIGRVAEKSCASVGPTLQTNFSNTSTTKYKSYPSTIK